MKIAEVTKYYYHGTTPLNAKLILEMGFNPELSKYNKILFLTSSFNEAYKYAKIANLGKPGTVLRVSSDALIPEFIEKNYGGIIEYSGVIPPKYISNI